MKEILKRWFERSVWTFERKVEVFEDEKAKLPTSIWIIQKNQFGKLRKFRAL